LGLTHFPHPIEIVARLVEPTAHVRLEVASELTRTVRQLSGHAILELDRVDGVVVAVVPLQTRKRYYLDPPAWLPCSNSDVSGDPVVLLIRYPPPPHFVVPLSFEVADQDHGDAGLLAASHVVPETHRASDVGLAQFGAEKVRDSEVLTPGCVNVHEVSVGVVAAVHLGRNGVGEDGYILPRPPPLVVADVHPPALVVVEVALGAVPLVPAVGAVLLEVANERLVHASLVAAHELAVGAGTGRGGRSGSRRQRLFAAHFATVPEHQVVEGDVPALLAADHRFDDDAPPRGHHVRHGDVEPAEEVVGAGGPRPQQAQRPAVLRLVVDVHPAALRLLRHVQVEDEVAVGRGRFEHRAEQPRSVASEVGQLGGHGDVASGVGVGGVVPVGRGLAGHQIVVGQGRLDLPVHVVVWCLCEVAQITALEVASDVITAARFVGQIPAVVREITFPVWVDAEPVVTPEVVQIALLGFVQLGYPAVVEPDVVHCYRPRYVERPGGGHDDFERPVYPSQVQVLVVPPVGDVPLGDRPHHGFLQPLPHAHHQLAHLVVFRKQGTPLCRVVDPHSVAAPCHIQVFASGAIQVRVGLAGPVAREAGQLVVVEAAAHLLAVADAVGAVEVGGESRAVVADGLLVHVEVETQFAGL